MKTKTARSTGSGVVELAPGVRDMLGSIPHMMWMANAEGQTEYLNARFLAFCGGDEARMSEWSWQATIHPDERDDLMSRWTASLLAEDPFEMAFRVRRHDGVYRWITASAAPMRDSVSGEVLKWIGSAIDIDDQKLAEASTRFLADASEVLASSLDVATMLQRVADRVVPQIADWCSITLRAEDGMFSPVAIAHSDPERVAAARELSRLYPMRNEDPAVQVAITGKPLLMPEIPADAFAATAQDERHLFLLRSLEFESMVAVPLHSRGQTLGFMQFLNTKGSRSFGASDIGFAETLARRVATAVDNAIVFERERKISSTFQHAALPHTLPQIEGITLSAVYDAAEHSAEVGGDWYDAFVLDDGRLVVSIGDVAGKGLDAAVLMANVRQAVRAIALQGFDPARTLAAADKALQREYPDRMVTAFIGVLDPRSWVFEYASAGHVLPLVRRPDGTVSWLAGDVSPPLGILGDRPMIRRVVGMPVGSLIVLFTDGLIESTKDVLVGEQRLMEALSHDAVVHSREPAQLIRTAVLYDGTRDDIAILTLAIGRSTHWGFDAKDAKAAQGARSAFVAALQREGDEASDYTAAELIFGELIGNVVRHAPGHIDIDLEWNDEEPVLHVLDRGPGFEMDINGPDDILSEGGRGMFIVATLGHDLSVTRLPRGSHVRVTLPVRRRPVSK